MTGTIFSMPKPEPDPHPTDGTLAETLTDTHVAGEAAAAPRSPLRNALLERGGAEMRRARRYDRPLSLILLQGDAGHGSDDATHAIMREVLESATRIGADIVMDQGTCRFACLLPETNLSGAMHLAARMQKRIATAPRPGITPRLLPVRAGFAVLTPDDSTFASVLARAETMLRPRQVH